MPCASNLNFIEESIRPIQCTAYSQCCPSDFICRVADALCATPRGLARTSAPSLETLAVLGPPSCTLTARDAKTPRRAMAELCSSRGLLDAAVGR